MTKPLTDEMKTANAAGRRSKGPKAVCPRCGRVHSVAHHKIKFTGRGTPRIYCDSCRYSDDVQFGAVVHL